MYMKMSKKPAKYEVLVKQYLRSILDLSEPYHHALTEEDKLCFSLIVGNVYVSCFFGLIGEIKLETLTCKTKHSLHHVFPNQTVAS